ncbi:MAG: glutamyl-tRNA reductase [Deltaproteobacteria bacterium]|jgi:glutamyl-tRNA reductase|nr:glutamyl-tRNA reductase [Deltaproteobacteria bacterium]
MKILLLGMSHRTAPVEMRERFAVGDTTGPLQKLAKSDEIEEAVLISTCNRVEIVATTHRPEAARYRLLHFLEYELASEPLPVDLPLEECLYEYEDREAIAHLFRVASSIDSMVVGEPQILGQVKEAYGAASEAGACGPVLGRLFQRAFATAKRVKNETRIAERPVSVARVAVELAGRIFEELADKTALMIGAGEMIELALESLQREGLAAVRVANRTRSRAVALARRFDASAHGFGELDTLLAEADLVLCCVGGESPLLDSDRVARALRARRARPVFFIDIGVPRNVDPGVNRLDNAYLYDLDDLQEIAVHNAEERRREADKAERIIVEERQHFDGWLLALRAVPTIRDLRIRAEAIRVGAIEGAASRLGLDEMAEEQREGIDALTRSIVNKILHSPLARLREETGQEEGLVMLELARQLFGLDDPESGRERR